MGNMMIQRGGKAHGSARIWDDFNSVHISQVFDLLEERFGFPMKSTTNNPKNWKQVFKDYYQKQSHSIKETDAFIAFGNQYINRLLNGLLLRPEHQGTFVKTG